MTPQGVLLDAAGVPLVAGPAPVSSAPTLVAGAAEVMLLWKSGAATVAQRFTPALAPLDAAPVTVADAGTRLAGAHAQGTYLVAWQENRTGNDDIFTARLSNGAVLNPGGVALASGPTAERRPSVTSDGNQFLVAYQPLSTGGNVQYDVAAARVTLAGTRSGALIDVLVLRLTVVVRLTAVVRPTVVLRPTAVFRPTAAARSTVVFRPTAVPRSMQEKARVRRRIPWAATARRARPAPRGCS